MNLFAQSFIIIIIIITIDHHHHHDVQEKINNHKQRLNIAYDYESAMCLSLFSYFFLSEKKSQKKILPEIALYEIFAGTTLN